MGSISSKQAYLPKQNEKKQNDLASFYQHMNKLILANQQRSEVQGQNPFMHTSDDEDDQNQAGENGNPFEAGQHGNPFEAGQHGNPFEPVQQEDHYNPFYVKPRRSQGG
jgi:hypothetical protein